MDHVSGEGHQDSVVRMTKPPGSYRHGDLRNALIAAATELTVQRGGPDFTLREIAALTGVRHAAVYRHFASKSALLEEIARLGVQALKARIEKENGLAPGARLEAIASDYLTFATTRPGEYRVMAQEGGASPSQYRALLDMMEEPIAAAQAAGAVCGDISADLPQHKARCCHLHIRPPVLCFVDFCTSDSRKCCLSAQSAASRPPFCPCRSPPWLQCSRGGAGMLAEWGIK